MCGGFLVGTLCLFGLVKMLRGHHRRRHWGMGYGGHCGGGGGWGRHSYSDHGGEHGGWSRGGFGGGPILLRGLIARLRVTDEQERVITNAWQELKDSLDGIRKEARETSRDVGKAFRADSFDAVMMGEVFGRHDNTLESVRKAFVGALAKVHDVLDEKQRARLADLLENGGFRGFYRDNL